MQVSIISSGSHGNAVVVNKNILIDCGVSFKALKDVYRDIQIVLLTHIHSDHFNKTTLHKLSQERPTLRFACCDWLVPELLKHEKSNGCKIPQQNIDVLEIGKIYDYNTFKVSPIKLYHDVPNCGYRVFVNGEKAIYCTDTRTLEGITAKNYDLYLIESNYEEDEIRERISKKQMQGQYAYEIAVTGRHLSKEQADAFLLENMGANSSYIYLHEHRERI